MELVQDQDIQIYYRKKFLKRSIAMTSFSLVVWSGIFFVLIFPLIFDRHPNVGQIEAIIWGLLLSMIFLLWSVLFIRIILECITNYKSAPSVAYSLTNDGLTSIKKNWFMPWKDVLDVRSMVDDLGYCIRNVDKKSFELTSWGIDPAELKLAKTYMLGRLPANKTKKLK